MLAGALALGSFAVAATPAKADATSTALIAAGAAAIIGALLYDGNGRPYYVRGGHRYYVTQSEANFYRSHHPGYERRAYVPEREFPVARDPYHQHY